MIVQKKIAKQFKKVSEDQKSPQQYSKNPRRLKKNVIFFKHAHTKKPKGAK